MVFDVQYISSTDGSNDEMEASDIIYTNTFYTKAGASIPTYDLATLGDVYGAYGVFDVNMYPGSSSRVVIGLLIDKTVGDIVLKVPNKNGNDAKWILCSTAGSTMSAETENSSAKDIEINKNYYPNTELITYSSVTGVSLKEQDVLSDGDPIYKYTYTTSEDASNYLRALLADGWTLIDYEENRETFSVASFLAKGSSVICYSVEIGFDEVWILP